MNDVVGVDTLGGLGMGTPFGTPDYGLDADADAGACAAVGAHAPGATRRRVRIALARPPYVGGEGGEWDLVEVVS